MKKLILLSTFYFLLSTVLFSQVKFNNIYEDEMYTNGRNVFALSDTAYAIVGGAVMNNRIVISVLATDNLGDFLWSKHYGNPNYNIYHGVENACIKTDGGYILAGSKSGSLDTHMVYLVKFDEQFDTLWTKSYFKDTNFVTTRGICNTDDGGFLIVGETELNNDSVWTSEKTKGLMLKVDADGNYQWFKSFGTDNFHENLYKAVQTHDGGYLVGGGTNSWQNNLNYIDRGDWYIVKTDSQGNEEWNRRYGNPIFDDDRITEILRASDTTYYITGSWTYNRNSTGSYKYKESYIVKLDKDFNELYELKYDNHAYYKGFPMAAIETKDSNIVLVGHRVWNSSIRSTLHKITPEGDVLWERQYVAGNDTSYAGSQAMSVKQTADTGFVFAGWVNNQFLSPTQQMWLVKTDSMGCDGTGDFWDDCTDVMVNEYVSNESFEMYPNPAKEQLTINIPAQAGIPSPTVEVYNLTGKLLKQIVRLSGDEASRGTVFSVDVSTLESGIYLVKVGQQAKKLVVE